MVLKDYFITQAWKKDHGEYCLVYFIIFHHILFISIKIYDFIIDLHLGEGIGEEGEEVMGERGERAKA